MERSSADPHFVVRRTVFSPIKNVLLVPSVTTAMRMSPFQLATRSGEGFIVQRAQIIAPCAYWFGTPVAGTPSLGPRPPQEAKSLKPPDGVSFENAAVGRRREGQ